MKLYHVYTINPIGEKYIENTYTSEHDAELFLEELDGALDPNFDAGIDEEIIDEKPRKLAPVWFEYYRWEQSDVRYVDAATGEPQLEPVWEPIPITRTEFLRELKAGNKRFLDVVCENQESRFIGSSNSINDEEDLPF